MGEVVALERFRDARNGRQPDVEHAPARTEGCGCSACLQVRHGPHCSATCLDSSHRTTPGAPR